LKKKILGIAVSFFVLYFTSAFYFNGIADKPSPGNINNSKTDNTSNTEADQELSKQELEIQKTPDPESSKNLKLFAQSAALIDADSGRVLYEKDGYKEMPMASTTKIMTCIVALENAKPDEVVTVSKYASTMPDVKLHIRAGEQYILKDLLYSLMLESHNDVAVAIAEHVGGSVKGFAEMMNKKAKELGCDHTNFVTPNGLDATDHYTTAVELTKIASYAIKNKDFIDITNTALWQFKELKSGRAFSVSNKDRFLYMYDGAIGVKTGFTGKAGYCFVGAVKKDNRTFVSAVLASGWPPHKGYKWSDTLELMNYGKDNFELRQIFDGNKVFAPVYVEDGKSPYVDLYYEGDIPILMGKDEKINIVYKVPKAIAAPVKANSIVGSAKYYVGKDFIKEIPIKTKMDIEKIDFKFCIEKIVDTWLHFK
jgi:D-alanyl-D-alanine carboxypeptidase (penicillin-binding protein 5/6)